MFGSDGAPAQPGPAGGSAALAPSLWLLGRRTEPDERRRSRSPERVRLRADSPAGGNPLTPRDLLRRLQRLTRATRNPSPRSAEASAVAARTAPWQRPDRVAAPRRWYGWWLLAAATAAITLQSGVYVFGFGVFFLPIVAEFGWSRAAASGAVSLARLENGLTGPLEGWLIDRWGPRRVMLVGIPLLALGFLAFSRVDSLLGYYVVYVGMLSLGSSLGFFNPCSAAVANWFVRRR